MVRMPNRDQTVSYPADTCFGSEIDVGFYPVTNGTAGALSDYFGFEPSELPVSIPESNHSGRRLWWPLPGARGNRLPYGHVALLQLR